MSILKKKIAQNFLISFGGRFVAGALGIVSVGFITRTIGSDGFGAYSTVFAFLYVFSVLADFGLHPLLTREIAKPDADETHIVSSVFSARVLLLIVFLAVGCGVAVFAPYTSAVRLGIVIAAFGFFFQSSATVLMGIFQKYLKTGIPAIADITARAIQFALVLYMYMTGGNFLYFLGIFALGSLVYFCIIYRWVHARIPFSLTFRVRQLQKIFKESWPMAVSSLLILVYFKGDTILLSLLKPVHDVGVYGVAYKILENIIFFPAMFVGLVMPLLSRYFMEDREMFRAVFQKTFDFLVIIALPLAAGGIYLASDIIRILAGAGFEDAVAPLQMLLVAMVFIFFGSLFGSAVIAIHRQKTVMYVYGAAAVLNIAANLYFISRYSYMGASAVTAATELFVSAGMFYIIYMTVRQVPKIVTGLKALSASGIMVGALLLSPSQHFVFLCVFGAAVYAIALIALGAVEKKDLLLLQQIFRPSRDIQKTI